MSRWLPIAPWRPIPGQGQSQALTSAANVKLTNAIPNGCHAVQLSAVGGNCMVAVGNNVAATAASDVLVKATDGPLVLACEPGDTIQAWGLAAGVTLYAVPVTH